MVDSCWSSSCLYVIDDATKEPIDGLKLGDLYETIDTWNRFSLSKFIRGKNYYRNLQDNTDGKIASFWDDEVIIELGELLKKRDPWNKEEVNSYRKLKKIIGWIYEMKSEYKDKQIFFSLVTKYQ